MNQWQQVASGEQEGHLIAKKQMKGFGGMLSFMLKQDTFKAVATVIENLKYAHPAAKLTWEKHNNGSNIRVYQR